MLQSDTSDNIKHLLLKLPYLITRNSLSSTIYYLEGSRHDQILKIHMPLLLKFL